MQGNSDTELPLGEGFTHSSLASPLGKILILAAQIVHSFQHKGKQSGLPFLGEASRKYFWLGCFPQHVVWWSDCWASLLFQIPVVHSSPLELCRDDTAHLTPGECWDVILLPLALCGSPTASVWSMGSSELQLGDGLPELLLLWWN